MGFLKPKMPPHPPPAPTPPPLPPATADEMTMEDKALIQAELLKKKKGYTDTILTSTSGDTSEANVAKKTLLGG